VPGLATKLVISAAAEVDYFDALVWYARQSSRAALRFEAAIAASFERIEADPLRFPRCDDRHRFCLVSRFPYQIIYRSVSESQWMVVAVAHTARRPNYWAGRQ
jgi:plasmid stabilization system protein ParE